MVIASRQLFHNNKLQKIKNGTICFLCDKLAEFSGRAIKITEKVTANDNGKNPEEMLDMLSAQTQAFMFLCIKKGDKNINVLHSLGLIILEE